MIPRTHHRDHHPHERAGLVTVPGVLVAALALALVVTVAMAYPKTASRPATTRAAAYLPGIQSQATALTHTSGAAGAASPIPPARHGRAGHEVTVLVMVLAPTAPGCGHMYDLTGAPFRLMGAWTQTTPDTVPVPTGAQLWWLTGHTVPVVEAADHALEAPFVAGCDHEPAFYVDRALSLAGWLSDLVNALLSRPFTGTAPVPQPDPVTGGGPTWL